MELHLRVKHAGKSASEEDMNIIESGRQAVLESILALKPLEVAAGIQPLRVDIVPNEGLQDITLPENHILLLPSKGNVQPGYAAEETQLREDQANRHLEQIRELIVEKSLHFTNFLQNANKRAIQTRSRRRVNDVAHLLDYHCKVYNHSRKVIEDLNPQSSVLKALRPLQRSDLNSSSALLLPNERGSTKIVLSLSWIWRSRVIQRTGMAPPTGDTSDDPEAVKECKCLSSAAAACLLIFQSFTCSLASSEGLIATVGRRSQATLP